MGASQEQKIASQLKNQSCVVFMQNFHEKYFSMTQYQTSVLNALKDFLSQFCPKNPVFHEIFCKQQPTLDFTTLISFGDWFHKRFCKLVIQSNNKTESELFLPLTLARISVSMDQKVIELSVESQKARLINQINLQALKGCRNKKNHQFGFNCSKFHSVEILGFFCHSKIYVKLILDNLEVLKIPFQPFLRISLA